VGGEVCLATKRTPEQIARTPIAATGTEKASRRQRAPALALAQQLKGMPGRWRAPDRSFLCNLSILLQLTLAAFRCAGDGVMFFYPWYPVLMLAVPSNNVIDIRLRKMATGGVTPAIETSPVVREKVEPAIEGISAR
jgi:hypothetical protein